MRVCLVVSGGGGGGVSPIDPVLTAIKVSGRSLTLRALPTIAAAPAAGAASGAAASGSCRCSRHPRCSRLPNNNSLGLALAAAVFAVRGSPLPAAGKKVVVPPSSGGGGVLCLGNGMGSPQMPSAPPPSLRWEDIHPPALPPARPPAPPGWLIST